MPHQSGHDILVVALWRARVCVCVRCVGLERARVMRCWSQLCVFVARVCYRSFRFDRRRQETLQVQADFVVDPESLAATAEEKRTFRSLCDPAAAPAAAPSLPTLRSNDRAAVTTLGHLHFCWTD